MSRMGAYVLAAITAASVATASADAPVGWSTIGRVAGSGYVTERDITVFPNGAGLPPGAGSVKGGRRIFEQRCAACHGASAEGNDAYPPLAGGRGSLGSPEPLLTVGSYWPFATTLWDYTRRAMPYTEPGTLSADDLYAVTAYVLHLNGILGADAVLDAKSLAAIEMPNRHGFVPDGRPDTRATRR